MRKEVKEHTENDSHHMSLFFSQNSQKKYERVIN